MGTLSLSFGNFALGNKEDFNRAMKVVEDELEARKPDRESPAGYVPSQQFKEVAHKFSDNFSKFQLEVRNNAHAGLEVSEETLRVLERGELLHTRAMSTTLAEAERRSEVLRTGKNPSFPEASSISETVKRQIANHDREPKSAKLGEVHFRLG